MIAWGGQLPCCSHPAPMTPVRKVRATPARCPAGGVQAYAAHAAGSVLPVKVSCLGADCSTEHTRQRCHCLRNVHRVYRGAGAADGAVKQRPSAMAEAPGSRPRSPGAYFQPAVHRSTSCVLVRALYEGEPCFSLVLTLSTRCLILAALQHFVGSLQHSSRPADLLCPGPQPC